MSFAPGYEQIGGDWFNLGDRKGFSEEVVADSGPDSPYFSWRQEKLRAGVPPGEFWFFVNHLEPGQETATIASVTSKLGVRGKGLTISVVTRY